MERFFQKMTPDHSIVRSKDFIQSDGQLARSSCIEPEDQFGIGQDNAQLNSTIEQIHSRGQRQTLRRLSRTTALLFLL
jgi:hypothetical protein